ncbi:MAG TPA: acetylxylan esterase, partial [Vicinamibacteria bacterium]|nr:acetylxylan esterase [Vicinamibacteria bacterium]
VFARPVEAGPRITPYLQYQVERAWSQDDRRRAAFESIRTEADLLKLQAEIRTRLLDLLGGLPEQRAALNARITGTVAMDGYRIEKLVFESLPGLHVAALVYVPDQPSGRKPAVLVACGHAPDGKAFKNYQEISGQLARRGYVVLCWDPVGQGERSQFWDAARGRSRYNLVCGEHAVLGNLACIAGTSLNRYMVWDGMRAVDYLLTRPDVDGARISITGTSGGGFQSAYIGALDQRIGAVAPSCFITALPARMANRIFEDPDSDPEQDPYGLVSAGIDHPGLLLLVYPRPLIVAAAAKDFVPIEGTRKTYREVAALYRAFGHGDRIALAEGYHGHMYSPENRQAAFAFLDRFNGLPARDALDSVTILDPPKLRCTPSGQVRVDLPGRSLPEVIRDEFRRRRPRPPIRIADLYRGPGYPGIADWPVVAYRGRPPQTEIAWEGAGGSALDAIRIDRYVLHHSERLAIPLLHLHREDGSRRPMALDLSLDGKVDERRWAEVRRLIDGGRDVLSFDLRGMGETRMRYKAASIDDPELAAVDEERAYVSPLSGVLANHVYNSLLTGRPYFLEMMEDVEIVARFARERLGADRITVVPRGEGRALAEAVAEAIPGVELSPSSGASDFRWSDLVEEMRENWPIQYLLPRGAEVR